MTERSPSPFPAPARDPVTKETRTDKRTAVAFLGLGAMGVRMASHLISDDIDLRVWNRSGVPRGFPSLDPYLAPAPAAAVRDADVVVAMVADDGASGAVWLEAGVLDGLSRGATAVECSTLSPRWVSKLAEQARQAGVAFVEAPVVGSRPQADAGTLVFLAGGETTILDRLRPTLLRMGSEIHHVGPSPAGAYAKLIANALFTVQVAALAELLGFARHARLELDVLMEALGALPVSSASAKGAAKSMLAGAFQPLFPLRLAAKDLRYAADEADAVGSEVPMIRAAKLLFDRAGGQGLLEEHLTAVAKLYGAM